MVQLSMDLIDETGEIAFQDDVKTVYLTPEEPLTYYSNKWVYHEMPEFEQWLKDAETQLQQHHAQGSHHLMFTFPENTELSLTFQDYLEKESYELGLMEMYAIEAGALKGKIPDTLEIEWVNEDNLDDYLSIHRTFAIQFGEDYADESERTIRKNFQDEQQVKRIVVYYQNQPVGSLDAIETEQTLEIDSFGVIESMRRQGIGRAMQAFVAAYAEDKPIILVADGEDTAKDMYIKQGYTFISYRYQILKENA
ncbi:GNAT family N-acetyltransferase [Staphylococcus debuckii]|uniref:GNAT family N-acetyltransferase n=1 Tax=Staphylococcus debuckii TaxID=2044912 RepID=A0ABU9EWJ7_9STAP